MIKLKYFSNSATGLCLSMLFSFSLLGCESSVTEPTTEVTEEQLNEQMNDTHDKHMHEEHAEHNHDEHAYHEHDNHDDEGHAHNEHNKHDHNEHSHHAYDGHNHDEHHHHLSAIEYNCTPHKTIFASYENNQPGTAHLLIDGIEYDLEATTTNKDAYNMNYTYISDIGLDETHGLVWQTMQDNATLKAPNLEDLENLDNDQSASLLFDCHKIL